MFTIKKYLPENEGKYATFKNIKFPRGNYQLIKPTVPRHTCKHIRVNTLLFTTKFSPARQFKNHVELFSTFSDESHGSQM